MTNMRNQDDRVHLFWKYATKNLKEGCCSFLAVQMYHHRRCSCTMQCKWVWWQREERRRRRQEGRRLWQSPSSPHAPLSSYSCSFPPHFWFDRQKYALCILARRNTPKCFPFLWSTKHHSLLDFQTSFHFLAFLLGSCSSCGGSSRSALSSTIQEHHSTEGTGLHVSSCSIYLRYFIQLKTDLWAEPV